VEANPLRLLYGEYDLTIDEKNRLLIPSEIRRLLDAEKDGQAFFLVVGVNRIPWLYPEKYYEQLALGEQPEMIPEEDLLAFRQMNFGMASRLEWDKQGRVLIPEKAMRRMRLERDVTLVGTMDHLEIWGRQAWEERYTQLDTRRPEIALRAKQLRQAGAPAQ